MNDYPSNLPGPRLDTANVTNTPNIKVQKYDLGAKITRVEANVNTYSWSTVFKGEHFREFYDWYKDVLNDGTNAFDASWNYIGSDVVKTYEFIEDIVYVNVGNDVFKLTSTVRSL